MEEPRIFLCVIKVWQTHTLMILQSMQIQITKQTAKTISRTEHEKTTLRTHVCERLLE